MCYVCTHIHQPVELFTRVGDGVVERSDCALLRGRDWASEQVDVVVLQHRVDLPEDAVFGGLQVIA